MDIVSDYKEDNNIKGFNRLTLNARRVIIESFEFSKSLGAKELIADHIFYILLKRKGTLVSDILNTVGVDIEKTILALERSFKKQELKDKTPVQTKFSREAKEIINKSFQIALSLKNVYVGTEHLLLAIFKLVEIDFVKELAKLGINFELFKKTLLNIGNYSALPSALSDSEKDEKEEESFLAQSFVKDLNELSRKKAFFNITGRDKEIERLTHILSRKTKNNPILVGDAGVGKTAIVEGFVNNIVAKNVPASFLNKKIVSIEIGSILAGARLRGDIEERIIGVINGALEEGNVILFIDEIHMIVGAGSTGSGKDSMDIANILKPYLTNSNLSIIGATTYDEYNKYFESDSALARRFQPVFVEELSVQNSKNIMYSIAKDLESFHGVKIPKESIDLAVELSDKYIKDRFLPDKAIDLIDEAAASLKIGREVVLQPEVDEIGKLLITTRAKKEKALAEKDYKTASKYKKQEEEEIVLLQELLNGKQSTKKRKSQIVDTDLIKETIVSWTKIPIAASDINNKKLQGLGEIIKKRIFGQDKAVSNVVKAIQKSHLGINGGNKPLGSFLFLGPTGVGKTELAKTLAKELFGSTDLLFQINMSEYMEPHSVAKLIGSPPGYVGYQEGGQLTTFVKRKPYSVILFDEIEKAHPDVLNLLLQILDEGSLTSGKGAKVSFKNTIIAITSNIGAENITRDSKLGFDVSLDQVDNNQIDEVYNDMRDKILEKLKDQIRPELLNRIDSIEVFRGLNEADCLLISGAMIEELILRLTSSGIILKPESNITEFINKKGYSKEYGARNIRRAIQTNLEDTLAEFLLTLNKPKKGSTIRIISVFQKAGDDFLTFKLS